MPDVSAASTFLEGKNSSFFGYILEAVVFAMENCLNAIGK